MDAPYTERLCLQTARLQANQNTNAVDQKRHDPGDRHLKREHGNGVARAQLALDGADGSPQGGYSSVKTKNT